MTDEKKEGEEKRKIGICQLDGHLPNLALMKIAGYHESLGDVVEHYKGPIWADQYHKIYFSKIFSFTPDPEIPPNGIIGGTGIDFSNRLPEEIEKTKPSYSLYPNCNYHLGFSMKGCRFNEITCPWCCVPKKEGRPHEYDKIEDILINPNGGNRLMLLDNDFFGGPSWKYNLEQIIENKLKVCFVQGLNIRILSEAQATLLSKVNYQNSKFNQKYLTFAWDRTEDERTIYRGIERLEKCGIPPKHLQFFVLIGHSSTHEENLHRVMSIKKIGAIPFAMPYNKEDKYQKAFTRWVNHRAIFKSCSWEDYKYNPERRKLIALR